MFQIYKMCRELKHTHNLDVFTVQGFARQGPFQAKAVTDK